MAALSFSPALRKAPPCGSQLCHSRSALGCNLSSSRWHRVRQPPFFVGFALHYARYGHLRKSLLKVWVEKVSSMDSWISETHERGSERRSKQTANQNLLLKLLIMAITVAAAMTILAVFQPQSSMTMMGTELRGMGPHYRLKLLGKEILIGERSPGWIYFWLLMAAGCGLFVSEEALNVWVGAVLARTLTFNDSWSCFLSSLCTNGHYIFSTIFWLYWGVCISDMVPFYAGRFAAHSKTAEALRKKVGVTAEKMESISQSVQRYGNLSGFVERLSLGVRNPTAFIAGAMGVAPDKFFAGVCLGALVTMPIQLGVGCVLREHPVKAVAGVAAAVAAWTVFPYVAAGIASIAFVVWGKLPLRNHTTSISSSSTED